MSTIAIYAGAIVAMALLERRALLYRVPMRTQATIFRLAWEQNLVVVSVMIDGPYGHPSIAMVPR